MTFGPQLVTGRACLSLDQIDEAAGLQTRIDRKYVVDDATLQSLVDELDPSFAVLEIDQSRVFRYESIYFDTSAFDLYLAAARRRRRRFKVRTRRYGDSGLTMLEVKTRGGRGETVKHRVECGPEDHGQLTEEARQFVVQAVGVPDAADGLRPVLTTSYQRISFIDTTSPLRVTLDADVRCTAADGRSVGVDGVIVETKSPGRPSAIDRGLWRTGHRPERLSKYATGLAALHPELPANKWHRTLGRHFSMPLPRVAEER